MSRILIAWELGGNLGHVLPVSQLARQLTDRGHQVTLVARDLVSAARLGGSDRYRLLQAPAWPQLPSRGSYPASFAEILLQVGYARHDCLAAMLSGWEGIISTVKPDLILADYAPTACLTAKKLGVLTATLGSGFQAPPREVYAKNLRPWDTSVTTKRLRHSESLCLRSIAASQLRQSEFPEHWSVSGIIYGECADLLTTIPELDHYGARQNATYLGPIKIHTPWPKVHYDGTRDHRIFVYLNLRDTVLTQMFEILQSLNCEVIAYCQGAQSIVSRFKKRCVAACQKVYKTKKL